MNLFRLSLATAVFALVGVAGVQAQDAVTATCKDGSSWSGAHRSGACRGHKGVEAFGTAAATAPAVGAQTSPVQTSPVQTSPVQTAPVQTAPMQPAPGQAAMGQTPGAPAVPPTAMRGQPGSTQGSSVATRAQAPGGGIGQVWVNTRTKVYHCPGDRYYGKTKVGSYMTEGAAKAAGDHGERGKSCS